eukprot:COSAG01_NODE_7_length_54400_cov_1218.054935_16_plen_460_part_00
MTGTPSLDLKIDPKSLKNHTLVLGINDLPGDKSITHRAYMLASLCNNNSIIENPSLAEDCENSRKAMQQLGVPIATTKHNSKLKSQSYSCQVKGQGLLGLCQPKNNIDVGNAGTCIRLLTGILSAQKFDSQISGDKSIQKRPMDRIMNPLNQMGAAIAGQAVHNKCYPPLIIKGKQDLQGIPYKLPMPSAQVKSAILFAGLYAKGKTSIIENTVSRDHSEKLLRYLGADILETKEKNQNVISISNSKPLVNPKPDQALFIPNDMSAAAFFIVLAACSNNCTFILRQVGMNPQRRVILDILEKMGLKYHLENHIDTWEPYADIIVNSSKLQNFRIPAEHIPQFIDEIPILAIAGCFATGRFEITGASELRVKESDRITAMVSLLTSLGAKVTETSDGFYFNGPVDIKPFSCDSFGDHRIAMSAIIAAHLGQVKASIKNCDCIKTSFPNFMHCLKKLYQDI